MNSTNTNEYDRSLENPNKITVNSIRNISGKKIGIMKIKDDP